MTTITLLFKLCTSISSCQHLYRHTYTNIKDAYCLVSVHFLGVGTVILQIYIH